MNTLELHDKITIVLLKPCTDCDILSCCFITNVVIFGVFNYQTLFLSPTKQTTL